MFGPGGVPSALREFAGEISVGAARVVDALTSIADALEARLADDAAGGDAPLPGAAAASGTRRQASPRARRAVATPPRRARAATFTSDAVRAALEQIGPATAAQLAEHINAGAGRRVVDGRSIGALARAAGARVVTRGGRRCYAL